MRIHTKWLALRGTFVLAIVWIVCSTEVRGQETLLISCAGEGPCLYRRAFNVTVQGKNGVRSIAIQSAGNPQLLKKARSVPLRSLPGIYREPKSGMLRVLERDMRTGEVVIPSKLPSGSLTASSAWSGVPIEYREQIKSKSLSTVPLDQFVAALNGPNLEAAAVDFVRNEVKAAEAHPRQKDLISGALQFSARADALRTWRAELLGKMRASLDTFRAEKVEPTRLEATIEEGLAAMRTYQLIAAKGEEELDLQHALTAEHLKLDTRFAIADALKKAGLHDPFLEKMKQIGIVRWSRPELVAGIEPSFKASAEDHNKRAEELFAMKEYARAFDEAQIASANAPCNSSIKNNFYKFRIEYVNRNSNPIPQDSLNENRNSLEQIVRELQGSGPQGEYTQERIAFIRKRISDGESLDKNYLPLQLKKAEFLTNIGELAAAQEVVTRIERTGGLDMTAKGGWLNQDATLQGELETTLQRAFRVVKEQFDNERYKEAFAEAVKGLKADPTNPKLLYYAALAAAIQRDQPHTVEYLQKYLRLDNLGCTDVVDATKKMFDLYRRIEGTRPAGSAAEGKIPHWMSGEAYAEGEVYYDPYSGGFHPHVESSVSQKNIDSRTDFRWDGFMVTSIMTSSGSSLSSSRSIQLELEPKYNLERLFMTDIGPKANSAGERRLTPLQYLNCPDLDLRLAATLSGSIKTRGWAGNPFFHPFLWKELFIFDLVYDELGRIKEAKPAVTDLKRPRSQYSEDLKFTWDGNSNRLLSIDGVKYHRKMIYDREGRLIQEKITYPKGSGKIEYEYAGKSRQPKRAKCEDNFYDKLTRLVQFQYVNQ
jgi:hypothetical protein